MRFILLVLFCGCAHRVPGIEMQATTDVIGKGAYCQPLNESVHLCRDSADDPWRCEYHGMRWHCSPIWEKYPSWDLR